MKNKKKYIEYDFTYLDEHIDMIKSKILKKGKISIFNGFINKIYLIEKDGDIFKFYYNIFDEVIKEIDYEEFIEEIMTFYTSSMGKITIIYRIFTNSFNPKTNGEFRELWGDILYIHADTFKFTAENINAENLSNIVSGLELTEEEIELFGRIEEYVFKDNQNNVILGIDLI
jgi:hypothetical protein